MRQAMEALVDRFHPDRVILFASHSRGAAHTHSDVDFLVVCPVEGNRRALQVAVDRALRGCNFARDAGEDEEVTRVEAVRSIEIAEGVRRTVRDATRTMGLSLPSEPSL